MKVIRPEQPDTIIFLNNVEVKPIPKEAIDEIKPIETIEDVMDSVIEEYTDKVEFKIALTKKQYEIYTRKGGICWLKKQLSKKR